MIPDFDLVTIWWLFVRAGWRLCNISSIDKEEEKKDCSELELEGGTWMKVEKFKETVTIEDVVKGNGHWELDCILATKESWIHRKWYL